MIPFPSIPPIIVAHFPDGQARYWVWGEEVENLILTLNRDSFMRDWPRDQYKCEYTRYGHLHSVTITHPHCRTTAYASAMGAIYEAAYFTDPVAKIWHTDDKPCPAPQCGVWRT